MTAASELRIADRIGAVGRAWHEEFHAWAFDDCPNHRCQQARKLVIDAAFIESELDDAEARFAEAVGSEERT